MKTIGVFCQKWLWISTCAVVMGAEPLPHQEWVRQVERPGISSPWGVSVAKSGAIYCIDAPPIVVMKFLPDGTQAWPIDEHPGFPESHPVLYESEGIEEVYVSGIVVPDGKVKNDFVLYKLESNGDLSWVKTFAGSDIDDKNDFEHGLALDFEGNAFITGSAFNTGRSTDDIVTIKYKNDTGDIMWIDRFTPDINSGVLGNAVAVGEYVYVTGCGADGTLAYDATNYTYYDYVTIKYDIETGTRLEYDVFDAGGKHLRDNAADITVDEFGNVYVAGSAWNEIPSGTMDRKMVTIMYPHGNLTYPPPMKSVYDNPPGGGYENGGAVVARDGRIYVLGSSNGGSTGSDIVVIQYDTHLNPLAVARYNNNQTNKNDQPGQLIVDSSGNVYVVGTTMNFLGKRNIVLIKYNAQMNRIWVKKRDLIGCDESGTGLALDNDEKNLYVIGRHYINGTDSDFILIKYNLN
jgi:hypothetical protein